MQLEVSTFPPFPHFLFSDLRLTVIRQVLFGRHLLFVSNSLFPFLLRYRSSLNFFLLLPLRAICSCLLLFAPTCSWSERVKEGKYREFWSLRRSM